MIEEQLLMFKATRKYIFWIKEAQFKYKLPFLFARLFASGKRYLTVRHVTENLVKYDNLKYD
jgi:hypothetical protein